MKHRGMVRAWKRSPVVNTSILLAAALLGIGQATASGMATPVGFNVTETGAATFNIPIEVPPGTAGIAPSLSLNYNSQGGNGLLGMGWSLGGLSAIYRCGRTLIQDGAKDGVNYNSNDKYCLDGQRLVAVSGAYGANNTEYRTERESFTKIISYGTAGSGPAYFKAWTKAGQIIEFGNTADSAIEAQGKTDIRAWAVNKIADTKGNYLTVSYTEDNTNGDYRPDRIDYTGNAGAGLTPYNSVRFVYQTRTDITPMYQAGSVSKTMMRLANVQTWAKVGTADTLIKDYRFTYQSGISTNRSYLANLQECAGTATPTCLNPTLFSGEESSSGSFSNGPYVVAHSTGDFSDSAANGKWQMAPADVNGDGKADMVLTYTGASGLRIQAFISDGAGNYASGPYVVAHGTGDFSDSASNGKWQMVPADVNGDGKADMVLTYTGASGLRIQNFSGNSPLQGFLASITTGLNTTISLTYKPVTDNTVYTKDTTATYPYLDLQAPVYVVSSVTVPNGIGNIRSTSYKYSGAKAHLTGGGFLGFRQFDVTDNATGIKTSTTFRQDYPYQGLPASVAVTLGGSTLKTVANTWGFDTFADTVLPIATANGSKHHFPKLTQSIESSWDLNSAALPTVTTANQYDAYGNATQVSVSTSDGYSKTTTNTYTNDLVNWYLGRLTRSTVTSTAP